MANRGITDDLIGLRIRNQIDDGGDDDGVDDVDHYYFGSNNTCAP